MADASNGIFLEFSIHDDPKENEIRSNHTNKVLEKQTVPPAKVWTQYNHQSKQTPDRHVLPAESPSSQHRPLHIRTRDSPTVADQSIKYTNPSTSIPSAQERPKHVIDLTEDDDDDDVVVDEQLPSRKKSRSSSDSSDKSFNIIQCQPTRDPTRTSKDPDTSIGYRKRRAISPPSYYPFLSHPTSKTTSTQQRSSQTVTPKLASEFPRRQLSKQQLQSHHVPQRPPSHFLPQQPPYQDPPLKPPQRQPTPLQYASAVLVRSNSQLSDATPEEMQQREHFLRNLSLVPNVTLSNAIDNTSPPTTFQFIPTSILQPGVLRAPDDVIVGCSCRKKRGNNECKYPNECSCLKDSGGDSLVKRSQYSESGPKRGCLMKQTLRNRFNIYECNPRCDCSDQCKNRVVQWGRKVSLEIFKTDDGRGWGLRCGQDLQEGQFVDTYRGEIITTEEADKRKKGANEDNYLFDFDKFEDAKYVCDGMHMGGPTRFMNHSCRPNCALFTVSYNHYDPYLYELAFFAKEFIPEGTELTFDYLDQDDLEGERITEEMAKEMEREKGYAPSVCRCGEEDCRGYFFFSK